MCRRPALQALQDCSWTPMHEVLEVARCTKKYIPTKFDWINIWKVNTTVPEPFLLRDRAHNPAEKGQPSGNVSMKGCRWSTSCGDDSCWSKHDSLYAQIRTWQ
ncbi:hypothetical protein ILYODFUR_006494 [Ilyodon furcidens]|uniref:Uncharacterized protein n=1 Tax=Ilyodon furcidens TaxID=33524 RepID=A0ABV0SWX7_9TELE